VARQTRPDSSAERIRSQSGQRMTYPLRGSVDVANLFNASNVLSLQRQFGATYLNALQIMGGRLVKLGLQVDF